MGEVIFRANTIVCPKCNNQFEHNKVNGIALLQAASDIDARKRMYTKLMLDALETMSKRGTLEFSPIRKTILDNINDFARDVDTILGIGVDAE